MGRKTVLCQKRHEKPREQGTKANENITKTTNQKAAKRGKLTKNRKTTTTNKHLKNERKEKCPKKKR